MMITLFFANGRGKIHINPNSVATVQAHLPSGTSLVVMHSGQGHHVYGEPHEVMEKIEKPGEDLY